MILSLPVHKHSIRLPDEIKIEDGQRVSIIIPDPEVEIPSDKQDDNDTNRIWTAGELLRLPKERVEKIMTNLLDSASDLYENDSDLLEHDTVDDVLEYPDECGKE